MSTPFNTVLATTDFSDAAGEGVSTAVELANALGARLLLVYVVEERLPPLAFATPTQREEIRVQHEKAARETLDKYAREQLAGVHVETRVRKGHPATEILECAGEEGADLIVMSTRGFGSIGQIVFGSTAQKVLQGAACPVVSVRAQEA